jgi:hypothetical protein
LLTCFQLRGHSNVPDLLAGIIITGIVCSIIVLGRFYSRFLIRNWGWDDGLILVAWLYSIAVTALVGVESQYGLGHQHEDIPLRFQAIAIRVSFGTIITYQLCLVLTKLSILFFYLRILKLDLQRILIWSTMVFVCLYGAVLLLLAFFICNPQTGQYQFDIGVGQCFEYYPIMTASAILHTTTDLWLIALVVPHLLSMILPMRQKIGLVFVLTLGLFDACASLTRLSVAYRFLNPKLAQWDSFSFAIWTTLETSLGIICASIPMLKPLVRQVMGKKPSSNPEVMRNVPRSKVRNSAPVVGGSLWTDDPGETQMVQTNITAAGRLGVAVESERSESVSSTAPLSPTKRAPQDAFSAV